MKGSFDVAIKVIEFLKKPKVMLILSAVLGALPLTFPSLFVLSWIAYVPFFVLIIKKSGIDRLRTSLGRWFLFGFLFNLCVYFWFRWLYPLDFLGFSNGMSVFIVLFAWIVVSLIHAVFYMIPGLLCHVVAKKINNSLVTVFAGVLGLLIALRLTGAGELAFPWIRVSLGQYRVPVLIQAASLFGIEGVDFIILSVNALLAVAILKPEKRRVFAFCAAGVFATNLIFGMYRLNTQNSGKEISAVAVQGNVLVDEKWEGKTAVEYCYDLYSDLSRAGVAADTDLVVWPETAVPVSLPGVGTWQNTFTEFSKELGIPIYMGVNYRTDDRFFNSAVMIEEDAVSEPAYKRVLVPFGEKLPYRSFFEKFLSFLGDFALGFADYDKGSGAAVVETEMGKFGSIICFESIFPYCSRESVQEGAQLLVTITNDAWLEDSPAAYQHLAHSVFRSIETSRSMIRCANVGASAFIDERGRIQGELRSLERGTLSGKVRLSDSQTFFCCGGYLFFPVIIVAFGVLCFVLVIKKRKLDSK